VKASILKQRDEREGRSKLFLSRQRKERRAKKYKKFPFLEDVEQELAKKRKYVTATKQGGALGEKRE